MAQWKRVGFRSRRLWVRSPPRVFAKNARCQDRTDDLGIMRPTRYRLRQPRPLARQSITPCGTRTRNLWIRSPTRYPLRQGGAWLYRAPPGLPKVCDEGGVRTHASEEIAALTQRLRPLGHLATCPSSCAFRRSRGSMEERWTSDPTVAGSSPAAIVFALCQAFFARRHSSVG